MGASECDLAWSQYLEVEKGLRELQEALQGFLDNWLSGWGSVTIVDRHCLPFVTRISLRRAQRVK